MNDNTRYLSLWLFCALFAYAGGVAAGGETCNISVSNHYTNRVDRAVFNGGDLIVYFGAHYEGLAPGESVATRCTHESECKIKWYSHDDNNMDKYRPQLVQCDTNYSITEQNSGRWK